MYLELFIIFCTAIPKICFKTDLVFFYLQVCYHSPPIWPLETSMRSMFHFKESNLMNRISQCMYVTCIKQFVARVFNLCACVFMAVSSFANPAVDVSCKFY